MLTPTSRLLDALTTAGCDPKKAGAGWRANCPVHDGADSGRSLSIDEGPDGKPLCHCHVCKSNMTAVCEAIRVDVKDILHNGHERTSAERVRERARRVLETPRDVAYEIRTITGDLVAIHTRVNLPGGKKRFAWSTPTSRDSLGGISSTDVPLYGTEHLADVPDGALVFVCEGEKAAKSLVDRGFLAVGTACGASSVPSASVLNVLACCDVVLWPDNDAEGKKHMLAIGDIIEPIVSRVRIFEPIGAKPKDDAADYVSRDLLADVDTHAKPLRIEREIHADIMRTSPEPPIDWIVESLIARGCLSIVHAPPKEGKSTMLWSIAAHVTRGDTSWGGFALSKKPVPTMYVSEEPTGIIKGKIIEHGVERGAPLWILPSQSAFDLTNLDDVVAALDRITKKHKIELVIIDTLAHWSRIYGDSENTAGVMEEAISKFRTLTSGNRAIVLVHHSKKSLENTDPISALRGSSAIAAACDNIVMLRAPTSTSSKDADEETARRIVGRGRHTAHNGSWWIEQDVSERTFVSVDRSPAKERKHDRMLRHEDVVLDAMRRLIVRDPSRIAFGRRAILADAQTHGEDVSERDIKNALARLESKDVLRHNGASGSRAGYVLSASAIAGRVASDAPDCDA